MVDIKIRNTDLRLESDDPEKLITLAAKLNRRLNDLANSCGAASDLKLALIANLMMEDQIETLGAKLQEQASVKTSVTDDTKKMFNEAIGQIAEYIDHLATRVEKG